jgi:hypothetical protein
MSSIYSHAASVTIWLGEEADRSSKVFDLLSQAAESKDERGIFSLIEDKRRVDLTGQLVLFLNRFWFRRIWVYEADICIQVNYADLTLGAPRSRGCTTHFCHLWREGTHWVGLCAWHEQVVPSPSSLLSIPRGPNKFRHATHEQRAYVKITR